MEEAARNAEEAFAGMLKQRDKYAAISREHSKLFDKINKSWLVRFALFLSGWKFQTK
jgi:hypothetical protein